MTRDPAHSTPEALGDQAERWFARMQRGGANAAERSAWQAWMAADPAHAAAYARVEEIYRLSAGFASVPEYRAFARAARERAERSRRRWRGGAWLGAAAVLVLTVGVVWHQWDPVQPELRYATAVGEQRTVTLDDGSRVLLDTDSAVTVRYSRRHRNVSLQQGRAQFDVAPAPERPFDVHAAAGRVRAVGTVFQVFRRGDQVDVALLEGVVAVQAPSPDPDGPARTATLAPGQRLEFDGGALWATHTVDPEATAGWTRGELKFRQRPLPELLAETNRYTPVKIRIGDPSLNTLRVSGVFASNDQASLLQALEHVFALRAERVGEDEIALHPRAERK